MSKSLSDQRMAENEVVFRQFNEKAQARVEEIKRVAIEEGEEALSKQYDVPLPFICECSDENCDKRIDLKPSRYKEIHLQRNSFVLIPGHEVTEIERVVVTQKDYVIVSKFVYPSANVSKLHKTDVDNS